MKHFKSTYSHEVTSSFRLAYPLVLTQLLDGLLGFVDTLVAARLDVTAIASLAAANGLFWAVICIVSGLLSGLDTYIPRAFGAKNQAQANQLLVQGVWIALVASLLAILLVLLFAFAYDFAQTPQQVVDGMWSYLTFILPSAPIILIFAVLQRYWQSQSIVKPFTFLMVALNCLNLVLDIALVKGWFGLHLGVNGIALSTTLCRIIALSAVLLCSIHFWNKKGKKITKISFSQLKFRGRLSWQLLMIGLPSFGHLAADVFAFNLLTFLAAQLGIIPLAAHQIMFMVTCLTVMVPIGISNAACIRIGQSIGDSQMIDGLQEKKAKVAAKVNLMFCTLCMSLTGLVLFFSPLFIVHFFTDDPLLVKALMPLMQICGILQIADGIQMVYVGILRAYGEVKRVFVGSVIAHYGIGLPLGIIACFIYDLGVVGLWFGVSAALFCLWFFNFILARDVMKPARFDRVLL